MYPLGVVLMIAGAAAVAWSIFAPSGVPGGSVINIDMIVRKQMIQYAGIAAFVAGAVFIAAGAGLRRLARLQERIEQLHARR